MVTSVDPAAQMPRLGCLRTGIGLLMSARWTVSGSGSNRIRKSGKKPDPALPDVVGGQQGCLRTGLGPGINSPDILDPDPLFGSSISY